MITMSAVGILGLNLWGLALWLDTRDVDTAELANTTKAQEAFIMDTYSEVTQFNYKQGEVMTLLTHLIADGRKTPLWQDEMQDLINRGILMQTKVATKQVVHPNSAAIGERISNVFLTPKGKSLAKDILYIRSHPQLSISRPKE